MLVKGVVQKGLGHGAKLGYPTVNIPLEDLSVSGIYAANVIADNKTYAAAAFADPKRGVLESYILDANLNLYRKEIAIELLHKIRDTKKFKNDQEARATISSDVEQVRAFFNQEV